MSNPTQGATPAPSTATPEAAAARESIAGLKSDPAFVARINNGDAAAEAELDRHQRLAVGIKSAPLVTGAAQVARAQIAMLKTDKDFVQRVNAGHPAAVARLDELERTAAGFIPGAAEPEGVDRYGGLAPAADSRESGRSDISADSMTGKQLAEYEKNFGVPDDPAAYEIRAGHELSDQEKAEEASVRGWMHSAGLPKADGDELSGIALRLGPELMAMDDGQREAYARKTEGKLKQAWGDDFPRRLNEARRLIVDINRVKPGLVQYLESTGLGDSFEVIHMAARIARQRYGK
ncbi:MAG: hypothetical protein ACLQBA_25730 [Candidatus Binataceae bacterium]